jgi:hypothetical protein
LVAWQGQKYWNQERERKGLEEARKRSVEEIKQDGKIEVEKGSMEA